MSSTNPQLNEQSEKQYAFCSPGSIHTFQIFLYRLVPFYKQIEEHFPNKTLYTFPIEFVQPDAYINNK